MSQSKKSSIFSTLQKVGQSLMMPVSVLPAAGLLVGLSRLIQDSTSPFVANLAKILFSGGLAIFENLPIVFAVGVAIGFSGGAGVAGLAAVVGYFTLTNVLKVMGDAQALEKAINAGVFGGILIGLLSAKVYNRFHQTKLHPVFGFFAGKRLVPILTAAFTVFVAIAMGYIWPPIQNSIYHFGEWVMGSNLGPAFYAAGKRLLIPVGLHHVYYPPFLYEFGEFMNAAGQVLKGDTARYYGGDPTAGRFMASEFPIMLFGLPAAAAAMWLRALPSKRKMIAGVMLSAALTSIITGITEPIEFAFIFVAPLLFVFHVLAAFCSGLLTGAFDIHLGYTFSASLIDFVVGFFNQKNGLYLWILVGPIVGLVYFSVFYWAIGYFNLKTPGREEDSAEEFDMNSNGSTSDKATQVLEALGGASNIRELDACITRLRLNVADISKVSESKLKALGASGMMNAGGGNLQVIFGVESDHLKEEIRGLMRQSPRSVELISPIRGELISITNVPDETFAGKILGDGFAIKPTEGIVRAPAAATVAQIFRTAHAIGLVTKEGLEVLIHVGIDTVKMNGEGFKALVKVGDEVTQGQALIEFDLNLVKSKAKSPITPVVITNMDMVSGLKVRKGARSSIEILKSLV